MQSNLPRLALWVFLLCAVAAPRDAFAYLDPATGSMVLQLVLGGVAGAVVVLRLFWTKILGLFGIRRDNDDRSED